jgi:hypothetical protein
MGTPKALWEGERSQHGHTYTWAHQRFLWEGRSQLFPVLRDGELRGGFPDKVLR